MGVGGDNAGAGLLDMLKDQAYVGVRWLCGRQCYCRVANYIHYANLGAYDCGLYRDLHASIDTLHQPCCCTPPDQHEMSSPKLGARKCWPMLGKEQKLTYSRIPSLLGQSFLGSQRIKEGQSDTFQKLFGT